MSWSNDDVGPDRRRAASSPSSGSCRGSACRASRSPLRSACATRRARSSHVAGGAIELLLELGHLRGELVLALAQLLHPLLAAARLLIELATSSSICCCSRAIASAWRSASSTSRSVRPTATAAAAARPPSTAPAPSRPARRPICRWPPPAASRRPPAAAAARVCCSCGRFSSRASFSSWRAASSACSASARCAPPPPWPAALPRAPALPLGFLLLPARELLQLLGELVDLLVGLLLRRALRRLVLVGHLVDFELEQIGELVGHPLWPPPPPPPPCWRL